MADWSLETAGDGWRRLETAGDGRGCSRRGGMLRDVTAGERSPGSESIVGDDQTPLDPAKVCVWHCDTGTKVFASLQCTHLPKRMSIGTRIPPHNRVSRQYRDGPDTRGGHALAPHQRCLLHVSIACLRRLTHRIVRIGAGISIRAGTYPHPYRYAYPVSQPRIATVSRWP